MKKLLVGLLLIGTLIFSGGVAAKEAIQVTNDHISLAFDDKGLTHYQEEAQLKVLEGVKHVDFHLGLGQQGEVDTLKFGMQAEKAKSPYPFAYSSSETDGTYRLEERAGQLKIRAYNRMSKSRQTAYLNARLAGTWVTYGEWSLLELPLFASPYGIKNAQVTLHLPAGVQAKDLKIQMKDAWDLAWTEEKAGTLTAHLPAIKPGGTYFLRLRLPASALPQNQTVGPKSQGEARYDEWQAEVAAYREEIQQKRTRLYLSAGALTALLVALAFHLWREKQAFRKAGQQLPSEHWEAFLAEPLLALWALGHQQAQRTWLPWLVRAFQREGSLQGLEAGDYQIVQTESPTQGALGLDLLTAWAELGDTIQPKRLTRAQRRIGKRVLKSHWSAFQQTFLPVLPGAGRYQALLLGLTLLWNIGFLYWAYLYSQLPDVPWLLLLGLWGDFLLLWLHRYALPLYPASVEADLNVVREDISAARTSRLTDWELADSDLGWQRRYAYSRALNTEKIFHKKAQRAGRLENISFKD